MDPTAPRFPSRRLLIAAALAAWPAKGLAQPRRVITILGDSITAGYGLPASAALPVQLQAQLRKLGSNALVRGAGVSGDTTAGGLARVDFSVQRDTDVCLVALGGNDLLQGIDPKRTQANLDKIVARLKARKIGVVLAGLAPPPVIDYLVIHELCHLRQPNHSPAYWREVARWCPDFRLHRQWLRQHGALLGKIFAG